MRATSSASTPRALDPCPRDFSLAATDPASLEIKSYSASPPASLFELPPGAKVMSTEAAGHS
jgi:hypothetical protein